MAVGHHPPSGAVFLFDSALCRHALGAAARLRPPRSEGVHFRQLPDVDRGIPRGRLPVGHAQAHGIHHERDFHHQRMDAGGGGVGWDGDWIHGDRQHCGEQPGNLRGFRFRLGCDVLRKDPGGADQGIGFGPGHERRREQPGRRSEPHSLYGFPRHRRRSQQRGEVADGDLRGRSRGGFCAQAFRVGGGAGVHGAGTADDPAGSGTVGDQLLWRHEADGLGAHESPGGHVAALPGFDPSASQYGRGVRRAEGRRHPTVSRGYHEQAHCVWASGRGLDRGDGGGGGELCQRGAHGTRGAVPCGRNVVLGVQQRFDRICGGLSGRGKPGSPGHGISGLREPGHRPLRCPGFCARTLGGRAGGRWGIPRRTGRERGRAAGSGRDGAGARGPLEQVRGGGDEC